LNRIKSNGFQAIILWHVVRITSGKNAMENLLSKVIDAHGGLEQWNRLEKVQVSMVSNGKLFDIQELPRDPTPKEVVAFLHEQRLSVFPFRGPDRKTNFTSGRIAIESGNGAVLQERTGSPKEIQHHMMGHKWDELDRANFNGYARWTYLNTPFLLLWPGFQIREIEPWHEGGEIWRCLEAIFPLTIASHSTIQKFYFGEDYLLRRHDYFVDVARDSNFKAAQYVYDIIEVSGIRLPTKRTAYREGEDKKPITNEIMVGIDITNVRFF
jgi:hypothetical protein